MPSNILDEASTIVAKALVLIEYTLDSERRIRGRNSEAERDIHITCLHMEVKAPAKDMWTRFPSPNQNDVRACA